MYKLTLLLYFTLLGSIRLNAQDIAVSDLGKTYQMSPDKLVKGLYFHIPGEEVNHGNTSVRNSDEESLQWKDSPSSNGFGYFERNRDLGQVFNVPEGTNVTLDALVLRTSLGSNAVMKGAANAEMYVVFFTVDAIEGKPLTINENGTTKGDSATHGFDHQFNRCDDYIEGINYTFLHVAKGGVFPSIPETTQPGHPTQKPGPYGEQEGHLRYFKIDFLNNSELVLQGGKRYAFMVGFSKPGKDRGVALAISTEVHTKEPASFVKDEHGKIKWGIRREGNGTLPPTMIKQATPPSEKKAYRKLINESLFPADHYTTLRPTSDGYPDVDTYRTLEYYLEVKRE